MNRRDAIRALLATLFASPAALPIPVYGQARVRRVIALTNYSKPSVAEPFEAFRGEMKALGYEEGRNITIDAWFGDFSRERIGLLAADAVASKPDVIFASYGAIRLVAALTKTIPIVSMYSADFVLAGLVKSLARPGGNITGVQLMAIDLVGKRIEILKEIVPAVKRLAIIAAPIHPGIDGERDASMTAARQLDLSAVFYPVNNAQELEAGLIAAQAAGADALVIFPDHVTFPGRERIAAFALKHGLPAVSGWDAYAIAGGLVSYGPNMRAAWRRVASHVDRILKGADPATLPVELPTIVELVVNLKTARALGVKIPQSVLFRADRVIG